MLTTHQDIDYKSNVFELPELTRIRGEPTTSSLLTLKMNHIPGTSEYTCPTHPTLTIATGSIGTQVATIKDRYIEALQSFREVNTVKQALIQKIVTALDTKFLAALHNCHTYKITASIPDIVDHVFDNYSDVTKEGL
eukprot:6811972-Ditylum_brightwellii.AAC.1